MRFYYCPVCKKQVCSSHRLRFCDGCMGKLKKVKKG